MSQSQTALVTGGAGFIASHIIRALLGNGYRVRAMDDLSGGKGWSRLDDVAGEVERIEGSVLDSVAAGKAARGADVIFHHAALVSVPESVARPVDYHEADATGTLCLLEAARSAGVSRFIYASTSALYGDGPEQPKRESMPAAPASPYAVAKYAGELYVSAYAKMHGLRGISLRYFNVFGPGQDPKSQYGAAVPSIVSRIIAGEQPTVYGDGEQTRDFCHVSNVVHANLLAARADVRGQAVNIGCGRRFSVNQIVSTANRLLGTDVRPSYQPPRAGDVLDSLADISLAAKVIGYEPLVQFEEGLALSLPWYVSRTRNASSPEAHL